MNIIEVLKNKNLKLAVAESCTGGLISNFITDIPGSSDVFVFGAVTYSLSMKEKLLSVSEKFLDENGPYNFETAISMAKGAGVYTNAEVSLATSGVAGPSDDLNTDAGTCYVAVCICGEIHTKKIITGINERLENKKIFAEKAIDFLMICLEKSSQTIINSNIQTV